MKQLALALCFFPISFASGVRVEFDPTRPEIGPFPSDFLTVEDGRQRTGRRINLPLPNCSGASSDCAEIASINQLDGFNPNARLSVKFSGKINPDTLGEGVSYVWLDPVISGRFNLGPVGLVTSINQPIYDPATNTAFAKPDDMLESSRRYLIVITDAVRDLAGDPVEADEGFTLCLAKQLGGIYCQQLSDALTRVRSSLGNRRVVGASIYTSLSASAWYEEVLGVVNQTPVNFARTGANNVVPLDNVQGATFRQHVALAGDNQFSDTTLPVTAALIAQFGVGRVAFGSFRSPRFLGLTLSIPIIPTLTAPEAAQTEEIFFHVWLPKGSAPPRGYPVLLAGHGITDSRFGMPSVMAAANNLGFAVIAMNAVGHGNGPRSSFRITRNDGSVVEFPAPGRGLDVDGDGKIDDGEGCFVTSPGAPVGLRDCLRQTVVDYLQLIHGIRNGIDLDGDGRFDLDSSSISYFGQSLGGAYGALLTSVSPDISASVLNVPPGAGVDFRLSQSFRLALGLPLLGLRQPVLLNKVGDFEDDFPLRYQPVKIRTTNGSAAIQDFYERFEWLEAVSGVDVLAPHMKQATLPGQPVKRVLFQMALGDRTVPNPSTTGLIRAANMVDQVSLYRFDIARTIDPTLPANPHTYLIPLGSPASTIIGLATLQQGLTFLTSGTTVVPDANAIVRPFLGRNLFETPAFLPEQ